MLAFLQANLIEKEMELRDEGSHLGIIEGLTIDGVESGLVPEFPGSLLEKI